MKALRILFIVVLLAVFAVVPASADPPPEAGIVTRGEDWAVFLQCDPDTSLCAIYGASAEDYCTGDISEYDIVEFQEITLPQHEVALRILLRLNGEDVQATVYPADDFGCAGTPVAKGTVRLSYSDNDVYGVFNNANVWGMDANGKVYGPDGTRMHLNGKFQYVVGPDDMLKVWIRRVQLN
jgi:hypothetical protein